MATRIWGRVTCKNPNCNWQQEDPTINVLCPNCGQNHVKHVLNPKIVLCLNNNTEGFATGTLSKVSKQINKRLNRKDWVYNQVKQFLLQKGVGAQFISSDIIGFFSVTGVTDGDALRTMANLLVCEGFLSKQFMSKKKYHLYEVVQNPKPCPYLIKKGQKKKDSRNPGTYECSFNFQAMGTVLNSRDFFPPGGQKP